MNNNASIVESINQQLPALSNNILFVENLNSEKAYEDLNKMISILPGFIDIRNFKQRSLAFIDFNNEVNAGQALMSNNFK